MPKKPTSPSTMNPSPNPSPNSTATAPTGARRRTAGVASEASDRSPVTQTTATTSEEVLARASEVGAAGAALSAQPTYDEIAQVAYERYISRGRSDGRDLDDWIEAERELRERGR